MKQYFLKLLMTLFLGIFVQNITAETLTEMVGRGASLQEVEQKVEQGVNIQDFQTAMVKAIDPRKIVTFEYLLNQKKYNLQDEFLCDLLLRASLLEYFATFFAKLILNHGLATELTDELLIRLWRDNIKAAKLLTDAFIGVYFETEHSSKYFVSELNEKVADIVFGELFKERKIGRVIKVLKHLCLINQFRLIRRFVELSTTPEEKDFVKKIIEQTEFFRDLIRKNLHPKDLKLLRNIAFLENVFKEKNLNLYEKFKEIGLEELADKIRKWLEYIGITKTDLYINPKISKNVTIFINQDDDITINEAIFNVMSIALVQQAAPIIVTAQLFKVFLNEQQDKFSHYPKIVIDEEWQYFKEPTGDFYLLVPRLLINKVKDISKEVLLDRLGFSKNLIKVAYSDLEEEAHLIKVAHFDLKRLTVFFAVNSGRWNIYLIGHGTYEDLIAGMSIEDFKNFIQFLSKNIYVNFLYYATCFGGGKNLIIPYKYISTNFVIAEQATTAAQSHSASLAWSRGGLFEQKGFFPLCEHRFCGGYFFRMTSLLSFSRFFNSLEQYLQNIPLVEIGELLPIELSYDPWRIILNYINPVYFRNERSDTALIKFPGADFFRASELGKSVKTVTEVLKRAFEFEGRNIEIDQDVKALLWYPAICNVDLILHGKDSKFVFMNPEKSLHCFKNVKAEELTVDEFGENILWGEDLKSEKIIVIKELHLKDGKVLRDCIFAVSFLPFHTSYFIFAYKGSDGIYYLGDKIVGVAEKIWLPDSWLRTFRYILKNTQLSLEEKYRKWASDLLYTFFWSQPILTKNAQLVAPWQENPKKMAAYAKRQLLGESVLTDEEKFLIEDLVAQESRVGKLKESLNKKLASPPSREKIEEQEKISQEWIKKRDEAKKIQRQKDIEKAAKIIEAERLLMQKQKDQEKAALEKVRPQLQKPRKMFIKPEEYPVKEG
ncbi:TPA: hypothetical protein DEO28_03805 [Candidatus Dependentiae bacterium]|nr:hypothetical protein [Candidatus Dependentiae bacterium]HBZ73607.1 hypothetical protein [Candidatus Dependentiae bacterium]